MNPLNAALAIVIVLFFAIGGGQGHLGFDHNIAEGAIFGLVLGIVVAVVICGLLAIAISIEKSVRIIANSMRN
jgi:hypothetical protein